MTRRGRVHCAGQLAGTIEETAEGYRFAYDPSYASAPDTHAISLTLPKRAEPFVSEHLFPFFYGLLAEGILKDTQCRQLQLDEGDHFGRLLKTAHADVIGDVTVVEEKES
ncbi:HipA N-terminal domain-containing protein [Verrucomicrobiota bacterium]